jgi:hypothetical protein
VLGQNQKFGEYTTLVNVSAKSTTLVNALAANGIGYHVSERIVGKPKPLIVDSLQTLSREEMSIQIRLTGQLSDRSSILHEGSPYGLRQRSLDRLALGGFSLAGPRLDDRSGDRLTPRKIERVQIGKKRQI